MSKIVFVGNASRTRGNIAKVRASLEDAILRCSTCKRDTRHKYAGHKEQRGNLIFVYTCRNCEEKYHSERRI